MTALARGKLMEFDIKVISIEGTNTSSSKMMAAMSALFKEHGYVVRTVGSRTVDHVRVAHDGVIVSGGGIE